MSTTVTLHVTPPIPVDPDVYPSDPLPTDLVEVFALVGQPTGHGLSRRDYQPWRWSFHLSGPDRVRAGQTLRAELERLGYHVDLYFSR